MNTEAENRALRDIIIDKEIYIQELKAVILDYEEFVGRMKEEETEHRIDKAYANLGNGKLNQESIIVASGWIPWDASSGKEKPPELSWDDRVYVLIGQGDDFISSSYLESNQVKNFLWRKEDYNPEYTDDIFFYQKA